MLTVPCLAPFLFGRKKVIVVRKIVLEVSQTFRFNAILRKEKRKISYEFLIYHQCFFLKVNKKVYDKNFLSGEYLKKSFKP